MVSELEKPEEAAACLLLQDMIDGAKGREGAGSSEAPNLPPEFGIPAIFGSSTARQPLRDPVFGAENWVPPRDSGISRVPLEFEDGGAFLPFSFSEEPQVELGGVPPTSVLFHFGDAGSEDAFPSEPAGERRTVAMVEVDRAARTNGSGVPQIIKDSMAPKFSGEPCDF